MIERVAAQPYNTGEVIVSGVNPSVIHWVQHYLNFRRQLCPLCIETNQRLRFSVRYVLAIAPATARNCQLAKQWWAKKPSKINKTSMRWHSQLTVGNHLRGGSHISTDRHNLGGVAASDAHAQAIEGGHA
jgi:hypothetical protein